MTKIAFACVGNAGRSQMATAFAERERDRRDLQIDVVTGGTDPAESVHDDVVDALDAVGIDIGDRTPRRIRPEDVEDAEYVVTMGCSIEESLPDDWSGQHRIWELEFSETSEQRNEIERRVRELFAEIENRTSS